MAYIVWDESFSVGIRQIDQEHQRLIDAINTYYEEIWKDHRQAFGVLLASLVDYAHKHFATEEQLFAAYRYPGAERHIEAHAEFTAKMADVRRRLEEGLLVTSLEVTTFLKDWLTNHIKTMDKAYSAYLREKGVS